MCISPNRLDDGTLVACRLCWQCKQQTVNDWAGRCIAESKTSQYSYYITLTYGRDEYGDSGHIHAAVLTYSDIQKYMKRVRKTVGKFKYFVVGEYGSERGRAHWHLIMFTNEPLSDEIKYEENYIEKHWPHGWSYFRKFHPQQAYYCCKYVFKDYKDDLKVSRHEMSKKPPLGHDWFMQLADQYVEQGIAPQDLFYSFPDMRDKNGKPIKYLMRRKTAENFCERFVSEWRKKYGKTELDYYDVRFNRKANCGGRHMPSSPVIEKYLDGKVKEWSDRAEMWRSHWHSVDIERQNEKQEEAERVRNKKLRQQEFEAVYKGS